jgi:Ran GTPase-activating protein (RanGAP) involved in mRNA processing and transport
LHGTKVSKTLISNNFQSALQENIFLQEFKIKSS